MIEAVRAHAAGGAHPCASFDSSCSAQTRLSPPSTASREEIARWRRTLRNASASFVRRSGITKSATTSTTRRRSRTKRSIACCTSSNASSSEHPDLVTIDSPTQRVAGRPVDGFDTVEHSFPMLSLDNAYNDDELKAFDERVRKGAGLGETPRRLRRGNEDRRPEHRADIRGRPAGARRHARRRGARRGRDRERAHDPGDSARAARRAGRPHRSSRRGLPAARLVRAHEPRARRRRRAAVREPAQRGRGHDAESRSGAGLEARPVGVHVSGCPIRPRTTGTRGRLRPTHGSHAGDADRDARVGTACRAALAAVRRHRRRHRVLPGVGRQAAGRSSSTPTAW